MEKIELITTIFSITITGLTAILAIYQTIKNTKKGRLVELAKIVSKIPEYIVEAEEIFGKNTGTTKMRYVLKEIQKDCLLKNINFEEKEKEFKEEIEKILETPKKGEKNEESKNK